MNALVTVDVTGRPNAHVTIYVPEKYTDENGVSLELLEAAGFDAPYSIIAGGAPGLSVTIAPTPGKARYEISQGT